MTGCRRGSEKEGEWRQFSSLAQLFVVFFQVQFLMQGGGRGERRKKQLKHPNTILKTMFLSILFYAKYAFPTKKINKSSGKLNK